MITLAELKDVKNSVGKRISDTNAFVFKEMAKLLKPFGEEGIRLYDHEGIGYRVMSEVEPHNFKGVDALRVVNEEEIQMLVDDKWGSLEYTDLHFAFDELVQAIEDYISEVKEMFDELMGIVSTYGSFNELYGCAKIGRDRLELGRSIDDYNDNRIACTILYADIVVEFEINYNERSPFKVSAVWYNDEEVDLKTL